MPARYGALHWALCAPTPIVIELSFAAIHRLGSNLPHRARTDDKWWSNDEDGHPQRMTWLAAGRRVQAIDVQRSRVWFALVGEAGSGAPTPSISEKSGGSTNREVG